MAPGAHLLIGWLSGACCLKQTRERRVVALSGIAPDLDGLGLLVDQYTGTTSYYFQYHHYLGHSLFAAILFSAIAYACAKTQKALVSLLVFIVVHLHILADIAGSKGPDGYQWPIYYLYPINDLALTWQHQWQLNAWQNHLFMLLLLIGCVLIFRLKNITFFEIFSKRLETHAIALFSRYKR